MTSPKPSTKGPRVYIDADESLYDEVYGRILEADLETDLADLVAEIEQEREAA